MEQRAWPFGKKLVKAPLGAELRPHDYVVNMKGMLTGMLTGHENPRERALGRREKDNSVESGEKERRSAERLRTK